MNLDVAGAIRHWFRHAWVVLIIAGMVIALDQWTKSLVRENIPMYGVAHPIPALSDYFSFQHVYNYGAAFGILQDQGSFFIIVAAIVAVAILVYVRYLPVNQIFVRVMLGLQLGGAIGNVIDRIYQGYVTDFIRTGIPGIWYIPNYNIADSGIVIGVIGLGIYIIRDDLRRQREDRLAKAEHGSSETGSPEAGASEKG